MIELDERRLMRMTVHKNAAKSKKDRRSRVKVCHLILLLK